MRARELLAFAAVASLVAGSAAAQSIVSVRSGAIHYTEGRVLLNGDPIHHKFGEFPQMKKNDVLRTERGRAEVLLTPGVFLRMGERGAFRMISTSLADTRVQILEGSVLVECAELLKDNAVALFYKDASMAIRKNGLYRIDADPGRLRVYDGKIDVAIAGEKPVTLKKGRMLELDGERASVEKFDTKVGDPFYRWSARRASYMALANLSAAKSLRDSGISWGLPGWGWNPYFGLVTFIPARGVYYSPFGYSFWSPSRVQQVYEPPRRFGSGTSAMRGSRSGGRYNADLGYVTIPRSASRGASAPAASAGGGASAPAASSRSAESSSGRGGSGGRRR
jgi:hypothetical protein